MKKGDEFMHKGDVAKIMAISDGYVFMCAWEKKHNENFTGVQMVPSILAGIKERGTIWQEKKDTYYLW